jgi:hypothetical protein
MWAWWCPPAIPATWEKDVGGSQAKVCPTKAWDPTKNQTPDMRLEAGRILKSTCLASRNALSFNPQGYYMQTTRKNNKTITIYFFLKLEKLKYLKI